MDRLDEWRVFTTVATLASFRKAARALGRSPQAVTRAVAALESRLGTRLLHRTTRSVSSTSEGARLLERGRRALAEFDALEQRSDAAAPLRGRLVITAPVVFGRLHVMPVVARFLASNPALDARLALLDRVVSLAEEGVDVAVRLGALPDSSLRARRVGEVRAVVCASPAYLERAGTPRTPEALAHHDCIAFAGTTPLPHRWSFARTAGGRGRDRQVTVRPRLTVNDADAAIEAAMAGLGVVRVLSYQVQRSIAAGRLRVVLASHEPPPLPVHLVQLPGVASRAASAFADVAAELLRARLDRETRRKRRGPEKQA